MIMIIFNKAYLFYNNYKIYLLQTVEKLIGFFKDCENDKNIKIKLCYKYIFYWYYLISQVKK